MATATTYRYPFSFGRRFHDALNLWVFGEELEILYLMCLPRTG